MQRMGRRISSSPKQWWWPLSRGDGKRGTMHFRKPIYEPKICDCKKRGLTMHHQKCFRFPSNSSVLRNDLSWLRMHFVMKTRSWFCRRAISGVIMAACECLNFLFSLCEFDETFGFHFTKTQIHFIWLCCRIDTLWAIEFYMFVWKGTYFNI